MALKPALTLKMGQQLRMTPQLQQAIRLLQLSTAELELEIQQALETNPMLEELGSEETSNSDEPTTLDSIQPEQGKTDEESTLLVEPRVDEENPADALDPEIYGESVPDSSERIKESTIAEDLPVDSVWEDVFEDSSQSTNFRNDTDSDSSFLENSDSDGISIQSHLLDQINLLRLSDTDMFIAMTIIDGLDRNGMLTITAEDVLDSAPSEWELELDEVEAVLNLVQHLDPIGIA